MMLSPNNPGTRTVEGSAQALEFAPGRKQARTLIGVPTMLAAGLWAVGETVSMAPGDAVGAVGQPSGWKLYPAGGNSGQY